MAVEERRLGGGPGRGVPEDSEADQAKQNFKAYEKANKSSAKKQKTDKPKSDKSDGAAAKGRKAEKGTAWSRFELGNRTVLGPSVYKKYCESLDRDWEKPVMFTTPDGSKVFKVLEVFKYTGYIRWARNPEQNLVEGEYF